jgi:Skp family chaperone for outer membrane proteins
MSREDELRLVAEMQRVSQQRDMAERELQTAQNVANMLHREREKNPIRIVQRTVYREPAAPPQVQPTPTVTPEQVQAAMQQAMAGERRNLRELLVHHNQSMADIVNKAAASAMPAPVAEAEAPREKKSRNYPRPLIPGYPTAIGSQKRKAESIDPELGPRIPTNPSAAISEANEIAKRMARKRPGGQIDPELGPRIPANPSAAIYDANQITKRLARKRPGGTIDAELAQRVPEMPAIRKEKAANLGKKLAAELTRRMADKEAREAAREAMQVMEDSKRRNPAVRLDQFDNKRPRASIMDDIEEAIAEVARRKSPPMPERVAQHLKRRPVIV